MHCIGHCPFANLRTAVVAVNTGRRKKSPLGHQENIKIILAPAWRHRMPLRKQPPCAVDVTVGKGGQLFACRHNLPFLLEV
jgi:hypothetical protein